MSSPATQLACCKIVSGVPDAAGLSPADTGGPLGVPVLADVVGDAVAGAVLVADGEAAGDGW
jgi:hypothetical protein